jgi:biopolymer transport protein ExbB
MMTSFLVRFAIALSCLAASAVAPAGAQQVAQPAAAASTDVSLQAPSAAQAAAAPTATTPSAAAAPSAESGARGGKAVATGLDELSPLGMFLKADMVVKAVMIALALASVASWTILIAKSMEFSVLRRRLVAALRKLSSAKSLAEAQLALGQDKREGKNVAAVLLQAAISEARLSAGLNSDEGIKERAASSFIEIVRAEARRVRVGMGLLATVGAISPFVGLFGTVWGIMNSFIGISKSQTTNLAVVAPGIAEALLATAIGLAAAIPAVIIYNHFSRVTKGYLELVNRASGATGRLLSRDLDRSHSSIHARAAE